MNLQTIEIIWRYSIRTLQINMQYKISTITNSNYLYNSKNIFCILNLILKSRLHIQKHCAVHRVNSTKNLPFLEPVLPTMYFFVVVLINNEFSWFQNQIENDQPCKNWKSTTDKNVFIACNIHDRVYHHAKIPEFSIIVTAASIKFQILTISFCSTNSKWISLCPILEAHLAVIQKIK